MKLQLGKYGFVWLVLAILLFFFSYAIPLSIPEIQKIDFTTEVNATMINGLFTGLSIIFAYVTYEVKELGRNGIAKLFLTLPLIIVLSMSVYSYFSDAISFGYPTVNTAITVTGSFFYTIFYLGYILYLDRFTSNEEEGKKGLDLFR